MLTGLVYDLKNTEQWLDKNKAWVSAQQRQSLHLTDCLVYSIHIFDSTLSSVSIVCIMDSLSSQLYKTLLILQMHLLFFHHHELCQSVYCTIQD